MSVTVIECDLEFAVYRITIGTAFIYTFFHDSSIKIFFSVASLLVNLFQMIILSFANSKL